MTRKMLDVLTGRDNPRGCQSSAGRGSCNKRPAAWYRLTAPKGAKVLYAYRCAAHVPGASGPGGEWLTEAVRA